MKPTHRARCVDVVRDIPSILNVWFYLLIKQRQNSIWDIQKRKIEKKEKRREKRGKKRKLKRNQVFFGQRESERERER